MTTRLYQKVDITNHRSWTMIVTRVGIIYGNTTITSKRLQLYYKLISKDKITNRENGYYYIERMNILQSIKCTEKSVENSKQSLSTHCVPIDDDYLLVRERKSFLYPLNSRGRNTRGGAGQHSGLPFIYYHIRYRRNLWSHWNHVKFGIF